jgi:hypothetical protein
LHFSASFACAVEAKSEGIGAFWAAARCTGNNGNIGAATTAAPNRERKLRLDARPAQCRVTRSPSLSKYRISFSRGD